jgi:hypothetical protein
MINCTKKLDNLKGTKQTLTNQTQRKKYDQKTRKNEQKTNTKDLNKPKYL